MPFCTILESLPLPNREFVKLGGSDLEKNEDKPFWFVLVLFLLYYSTTVLDWLEMVGKAIQEEPTLIFNSWPFIS